MSVGLNCNIAAIGDMGEVVDDEVPQKNGQLKVIKAEVAGVMSIDTCVLKLSSLQWK